MMIVHGSDETEEEKIAQIEGKKYKKKKKEEKLDLGMGKMDQAKMMMKGMF